MMEIDDTVLVVIDIQGKLAQLMHEKNALFDSARKLIQGAQILDLPILWTEQCPDKLGPTVPEIAELLCDLTPFAKSSFSCSGCEPFMEALHDMERNQVLLCGIESHICVYQTAAELADLGYEIHVAADAVSSRTAFNRDIGLQKMRDVGADITSVEAALFELMRVAEGDRFRQVARLIK